MTASDEGKRLNGMRVARGDRVDPLQTEDGVDLIEKDSPTHGSTAGRWAPIDAGRAQALAERLHDGQRDASGAPLIDHIRRVAAAVPRSARVVAWLHEVLEHTAISEQALLAQGVSDDELRALRLLTRNTESRSYMRYLAHVQLIADARGPGAGLAQHVKRADLVDRAVHPSTRADGWTPPYALALQILQRTAARSLSEPFVAVPETRADLARPRVA
jgi:hypothetical protein